MIRNLSKKVEEIRNNQINNSEEKTNINLKENTVQQLFAINKWGIDAVCVSLQQKKDFNTRIALSRQKKKRDNDIDAITAYLNSKDGTCNATNAEIIEKIEGI